MLVGLLLVLHVASTKLRAQQATAVERGHSINDLNTSAQVRFGDVSQAVSEDPSSATPQPAWQYGGFVDLGYLLDFNHPANRLFRSRGTAFHVDRVQLNMAGVYAKKKATEESRWGVEVTAHTGKDSELFGFSATAPNIAGFKFLRHLGPTNVSYLAPAGKGLSLQAGIFTSFIGYDSLYAKDNFNYTRPWGADFTPYLMMGVNASYPISEKLTGSLFVVNGYWHLARTNNEGLRTMSEFFRKWRQGSFVFLTDLSLLKDLCLAEFIVWRVLRRSRKENAARRKHFKLLSGQPSLIQAHSCGVRRIDWPRAILRDPMRK